jgi:hypothetical protein
MGGHSFIHLSEKFLDRFRSIGGIGRTSAPETEKVLDRRCQSVSFSYFRLSFVSYSIQSQENDTRDFR